MTEPQWVWPGEWSTGPWPGSDGRARRLDPRAGTRWLTGTLDGGSSYAAPATLDAEPAVA